MISFISHLNGWKQIKLTEETPVGLFEFEIKF